MDDLPPHLLLQILHHLNSSPDLARCRIASKTFDTLSQEIRSINLYCSYTRYANSRSPLTRSQTMPFKILFNKLVNELPVVEHVAIGVDKALSLVTYDDSEDEHDDLFLCDVRFLKEGLVESGVCKNLKSFSVSDFWVQSCWRRTDLLSLLSTHCHKLGVLEIKNAWLSINGFTPMTSLTTLNLEFIRLEDENLEKINECFPSLQVLKLIGVGGLKEPKINFMHLQTCLWTLSNHPASIAINAPSLVKLDLKCVRPDLIVINTPLLSDLYLSLESAFNFTVKDFSHLSRLHLESTKLRYLLPKLKFGRNVRSLTIDSTKWEVPVGVTDSNLDLLLSAFPSVSSVTLTSGAWSEFETYPGLGGVEARSRMKGLKRITAYLTVNDIEVTLSAILFLLDNCTSVSSMALLVHQDVVSGVTSSLISRCSSHCSKVRWKWGIWKEGSEDSWISDGI